MPFSYHSLQGSVFDNTGAKTAGYYIRENYDNAEIFIYLRPATAHYYFNLPVIGSTDMDEAELFSYFNSVKEEVDLVVFKEKNYRLIKPYLNSFNRLVEIKSNGETVMYIYARKDSESGVLSLNTEEYDKLFDLKYGNINSLNFGIEEQIKKNKKMSELIERIKGGFFGFIFK